MSRAVRLVLLIGVLTPTVATVGCESKSDGTPNSALGSPPNVPPGRGGGDKGIAPTEPKGPRQPKPPK